MMTKKLLTVVLVLISGLICGCAQIGIMKGERVALIIKTDESLKNIAQEIEKVVKENTIALNCPITMVKIVEESDLSVAGVQPSANLFAQVPQGTEKLLIIRLTKGEEKGEFKLRWGTTSMKTWKTIAEGGPRNISLQNKEKLLEILYEMIRTEFVSDEAE